MMNFFDMEMKYPRIQNGVPNDLSGHSLESFYQDAMKRLKSVLINFMRQSVERRKVK